MSDKVRRVDYHPDEYISGVGGVLTAEEQGVYWMICSIIMSEGGPTPFDERRLAAQCLLRPSKLRKIVEGLVSRGKIKVNDDGELYQNRALSEVEKSSKRIQKAAENGAKGGRPAAKSEQNQQNEKAAGYSDDKLTTNHQPATINEEKIADACPKPQKKRHSYSEAFERFWAGYPSDSLMSKLDASKAFEKLSDEDQEQATASLPAFKAYCSAHADYRPVHANRYITSRRFEGFMKTQQATDSRQFVALGSDAWGAIMRHRGVTTMAHTEKDGARGWWFSRDEVAEALRAPRVLDWQSRGAA